MKRTTIRFGLGVAAIAAVVATLLAVLAVSSLSWIGHRAEAQDTPTLLIKHVNPDGGDFHGNPFCSQTVWSADGQARVTSVVDWHDCNNAAGQHHVIRTEGWSPPTMSVVTWNLQNDSGANAAVVAEGRCGDLAEVVGRTIWDPANDDEQCVAVASTTPGETSVTLTYDDGGLMGTTNSLVKEWDTFVDTVILKAGDVELVTLPSPFPPGTQVYLPLDADGDGNRDAPDEHLMDHNGEIQEHPIIFDEALKENRSAEGPIQLIESVHGQHADFADHPTEGAVVLAFIDSPRGCTYFTDPTGQAYFGTAVVGVTDWRGFFLGPQLWPPGAQFTAEALAEAAAAGLAPGESNNGDDITVVDELLGVYADTLCEEQATITFKVGYPNFVQSVPEIPAPEWVRFDWISVEVAKQPQIRWAGEEIVLEKRWALPGEWYPNGDGIDNDEDTLVNEDPADDDGDGLVNEEFPPDGEDTDQDGNEDGSRADPGFGNCNDGGDNDEDGTTDAEDASCAAFVDEDTGVATAEDDDDDCVGDPPADPFVGHDCSVAGGIDEDGPDVCPLAGLLVRYTKLGGPGGLIAGVPDIAPPEPIEPEPDIVWTVVGQDCVSRAIYSSEEPGHVDVEALLLDDALNPINMHAFLVWYLKIYQVKLTNIPLTDNVGRQFHSAGVWQGEDAITAAGVTAETLNVSQDALARVTVKGYFYGGNPSGRGDTCVDMDGDGDGAGSEPGEPYPTTAQEGCADPDDHALAGGYWVLPDDIEDLAGPHPDRLATWDVMSEPDVAAEDLIGYKSTLDSHDDVLRRVVECVVLGPDGSPNFDCLRKTVDPDGQITDADAIMPPLKILARIVDNGDGVLDVGESGFLRGAVKGVDLNITSAYQRVEIPASPWIPAIGGNGGYAWDSWGFNGPAQGPYGFFDILTKQEELDALGRPYVRSFEFYTDNRGLGYFFVNGDFKLTFDDCPLQPLSGTPDCSPGDVVGKSVVTVIGDYPYFRKHPAVESNPVEKTWLWGGFTSVTAEHIDATHTAIIAHLKDRDGFCKWDVGADPTQADSVVFSPSLNEVQHEWIEFLLNDDVGFIRDVSPNALYLGDVADQHSYIDPALPLWQVVQIHDHVHVPLAEEWSTGLEPDLGRFSQTARAAVARAEDVRVLNFYGEAMSAVDDDECQAWIVLEHPADQTPNVSVVFHNPEGNIDRHWPPAEFVSVLVPGWNDSCYTGPEIEIDDALRHGGLIEEDGATHVLAVYRFSNDESQSFDRWFPGRPEVSTITTLNPYDQLIILMGAGADWTQEITLPPGSAELVQGWNSVCYAGPDKSPDEATAGIQGDFPILYTVASDQTWRRCVPDYPWATNIVSLNQYTSVSMLVTAAGGTTWVFDPLLAPSPTSAPTGVGELAEADLMTPGTLSETEMCAPVLPGTYLGAVTLQGLPAPDGTMVHASIGGIEWAAATTSGGLYVLDVPQAMPVVPPCFAGGEITFEADDLACRESAAWSSGLHELNLTCGLTGNVDCDEDVDAVDALFILQHVVGLRSASDQCPLAAGELYLPAADAQCDDDVDAVDALFVLQHVVGLRPVLCPGP